MKTVPEKSEQAARPKHAFTVEEFQRLAEAGIVAEDERIELIGGELIEKAPIGSRHAATVAKLEHLLAPLMDAQHILWTQNPVRLGDCSAPEPDLAIIAYRPDFYAAGLPGPEAIALVVEVAESSLQYDQDIKIPLYARAGIPQAWLVDVQKERLSVYEEPGPEGYEKVWRPASPGTVPVPGVSRSGLDLANLLVFEFEWSLCSEKAYSV